jgi:NAD(P)-dependent dehydrogenase (short-subunit alcohol dehydrogenase family)
MPKGSKPGERRSGRQRGTPNKKTVLRNAAVCAAALDPNISPRDFMLGLVRNSDLPLAERFTAAQAVLPLVHPKLTSGHRTQNSIDTLVKYFAAALGPRGIRVNAVAPGVIDTDMSNLVKTDEGKSFVLGLQALKRIGQPDDVGSVVAFLASQDARWITGDTIRVDGGSKL